MNLCFLNTETSRILSEFLLSRLVRLSLSNSALLWEKPRKNVIVAPQGLLFHCLENAQQCLYPSVNFRVGPRSYSSLCSSPSLTVCCDEDDFHRAARVLGACPVRQLSPWLVQQAGWACPGRRQTGLPLQISVQCRPGNQGRMFSPVGKCVVKRISDLDE